jgi:hypothetical protein
VTVWFVLREKLMREGLNCNVCCGMNENEEWCELELFKGSFHLHGWCRRHSYVVSSLPPWKFHSILDVALKLHER